MKWFQYTQNNSGGRFDVDDKVSNYVLIQAHNGTEADGIAEVVGIYFNGVEDGNDCECCGDRWDVCCRDKGTNAPGEYNALQYGEGAVRIYPYGASEPVSIADFKNNPPMVIEPS